MFATLLKTEFLRYGRSSWIPMLVLFYDSILALITILFMYTGSNGYRDYMYYNSSPYLNHFLVLSSIEIVATLLLVPILVGIMYNGDQEHHIIEQFALIPGATVRYTCTKVVLPVVMNFMLFLSGVPMLLVACIYSDTSFLKLGRLSGIIFAFSLWSAAITTLSHSIWKRWGSAVFIAIILQFVFIIGSIFVISLVGEHYSGTVNIMPIPEMTSRICLILLLLNPFCTYMGFYGNLTGDIGIMNSLCGAVGIDSTSGMFSMLFYKTTAVGLILMAVILTMIACLYTGRTSIKSEKMEW